VVFRGNQACEEKRIGMGDVGTVALFIVFLIGVRGGMVAKGKGVASREEVELGLDLLGNFETGGESLFGQGGGQIKTFDDK